MKIYSKRSVVLFGLTLLWLGGTVYLEPELNASGKQSNVPSHVGELSAPLYGFRLPDIDGRPVDLKKFKGKVLLIVNTASMCGNTRQYAGLQEMYDRYRDRGFEILAFPANHFGQQEPGTNEEIKEFCYTKYSISFPLFSKISVVGKEQHPLYRYLTQQSSFPGRAMWNFQKYLVDRSGHVIGKYDPGMNPLSPTILLTQRVDRGMIDGEISTRHRGEPVRTHNVDRDRCQPSRSRVEEGGGTHKYDRYVDMTTIGMSGPQATLWTRRDFRIEQPSRADPIARSGRSANAIAFRRETGRSASSTISDRWDKDMCSMLHRPRVSGRV
jgi:glutathione peroxidase